MNDIQPIQTSLDEHVVSKDNTVCNIHKEAQETLAYLRSREDFWEQILVGNRTIHHTSFAGKPVESLRLKYPK